MLGYCQWLLILSLPVVAPFTAGCCRVVLALPAVPTPGFARLVRPPPGLVFLSLVAWPHLLAAFQKLELGALGQTPLPVLDR